MKKVAIILSVFFLATAFTTVAVWKNDKAHSQLAFTITHLGVSDVSGTFNDFDVEVKTSKPDFSDAEFTLSAKVSSVDTRIEMRDNHLKSPDFFDAAKYPEITFKSTVIKSVGKNKYKLTCDLTLKGVTKPVVLDLLYRGVI